MRIRLPFRRRQRTRGAPAKASRVSSARRAPKGAQSAPEGHQTAGPKRQRDASTTPAWTHLPALRTLAPLKPAAKTLSFAASLAVRQPPKLVLAAPLHRVDPDWNAGTVEGLVKPSRAPVEEIRKRPPAEAEPSRIDSRETNIAPASELPPPRPIKVMPVAQPPVSHDRAEQSPNVPPLEIETSPKPPTSIRPPREEEPTSETAKSPTPLRATGEERSFSETSESVSPEAKPARHVLRRRIGLGEPLTAPPPTMTEEPAGPRAPAPHAERTGPLELEPTSPLPISKETLSELPLHSRRAPVVEEPSRSSTDDDDSSGPTSQREESTRPVAGLSKPLPASPPQTAQSTSEEHVESEPRELEVASALSALSVLPEPKEFAPDEEEIPAPVRRALEPLAGDLTDVRVNRSEEATIAADAMKARAFTAGQQVHLPRKHGSLEGAADSLLVHELVHLGQQRHMGSYLPSEESTQGRRLEGEAQRTEKAWESGLPLAPSMASADGSREGGFKTVFTRATADPTPTATVTLNYPAATSSVQRASDRPATIPEFPEASPPPEPAKPVEPPPVPAEAGGAAGQGTEPEKGEELKEMARKLFPYLRPIFFTEILIDRERNGLYNHPG